MFVFNVTSVCIDKIVTFKRVYWHDKLYEQTAFVLQQKSQLHNEYRTKQRRDKENKAHNPEVQKMLSIL